MHKFAQVWLPASILAVFAGVLVLLPTLGAADKQAGLIADADLTKLVGTSSKALQEALGGKIDKPATRRARTTALLLAAAAQSGEGASTPARATLRDQALKIADAIKAEKYDDAKKLASELATLKPNSAAKTGTVEILKKQIELDDVMSHFASPRGGGLGLEKKLEDWAEEKKLPADAFEEIADAAQRYLVISDLIKGHKPDSKANKWPPLVAKSLKASQTLAEAAKKKDSDATLKALKDVNQSCNDCHKEFK